MSKFYVYVHKRLDNGEVFYVGKGSGLRYKNKTGRGHDWKVVVSDAGGFVPEILFSNLEELESFELEKQEISKHKNLVNFQKSFSIKKIPEELLDVVVYDESSSSGLSWKTPKNNRWKKSNKAGSLSKSDGYYYLRYKSERYSCHRIIWKLLNKEEFSSPEFVIDHIDGNRTNNKINNLQKITRSENQLKRVRNKNNSSNTGIKGLSLIEKGKCYLVFWTNENGTTSSKRFSAKKCGTIEKALSEALLFRDFINKEKEN